MIYYKVFCAYEEKKTQEVIYALNNFLRTNNVISVETHTQIVLLLQIGGL